MRLRIFAASVGLLAATGGCALERGIGPAEQMRLVVGPAMVTCNAWYGPTSCLQVRREPDGNWQNWFDEIDGFTWEEGYVHEIVVEVFRPSGPIPLDGSDRVYHLKRVVSKVPAGFTFAARAVP